MSSPQILAAFEHFTRLNSATWFYQPSSTAPSHDPDLILILGWMDASPRNIAKYAAGYEKLYPSSRIVVLTTSSIDAAFSTWAANRRRAAPLLEVVYSLPPESKILLHLFSNGGASMATLMATVYREKTGRPLPVTVTIMDSAPGHATVEATLRAFSVGLPKNFILRALGKVILRVALVLYGLSYFLLRKPNMVEWARRGLNMKDLFDTDVPRMYIYSEADDMVNWKDVEQHGEDAKKLGYAVEREKFLESRHAGHLLIDPKRYWDAVQRIWSTVP